MTEQLLILLTGIVCFLPLFGFLIVVLFGKRLQFLYFLEIVFMGIALAASIVVLYFKLTVFSEATIIAETAWVNLGRLLSEQPILLDMGIRIDNLAAILMFTVCLVSFLVHVYSVAYMHGDKRFNRYFAYLGLFTFSMMGIVVAQNLLLIYICWELVGLSSYLLIGFWYEKKSASDASKKAFIVNRVGDLGMFAGLLLLFLTYQTFNFQKVFEQIGLGVLPFDSGTWLTIMGVLIFCGAIGKSAQFPLHVWLPDAMEGPTPVSALIHAATMVAAGVYLIARIFPLLTGDALMVIAVIGAISAFIPATIAVTQRDIKKILAYSTISQLGLMVMALGIGAYGFGVFHLITHAFFKAGLFLGAGSVIYAMHHEQDITKMGGLRKLLPITYAVILIYSLSMSGTPFTAGFLSKDGIIASAVVFGMVTGNYLFAAVSFIVTFFSSFYMFRLIIVTFHGAPRYDTHHLTPKESPATMTVPLMVLALLSFFFWFGINPFKSDAAWFVEEWVSVPHQVVPVEQRVSFFQPVKEVTEPATETTEVTKETTESVEPAGEEISPYSPEYKEAMHKAEFPTMLASIAISGFGMLFAFLKYRKKTEFNTELTGVAKPLYLFSFNKWYFDEIYETLVVQPVLRLTRFLAKFDQIVIDGAVNGSAWVTQKLSILSGLFDNKGVDGTVNLIASVTGFFGKSARLLQSGRIQSSVVLVLFSIIILIFLIISLS